MQTKSEQTKPETSLQNYGSLAPAQMEQKACEVEETKAIMPVWQIIPLSMLAGLFIGCGALFMLVVKSDTSLSFAASQVLGGLCFSLGLICVIVCGAELFTGNNLMVIGALERRYAWRKVIRNWIFTWTFNLLGSLLLVVIVYFANIAAMNNGEVGQAMINNAVSKINLDWITIFFRGIICNFLVCLAVWMSFSGKNVIDKIFTSIFPVMAFVSIGAEHCVANMFFLPMGLAIKNAGVIESTNSNLACLNLGGVFYNISAATLGNLIGGCILVGMMYWWAYHKRKLNS